MAPKVSKAEKKMAYDQKLCQLLDEYSQVLIAVAGNVGSNQLQSIRKGLRYDSVVLMGKNTLMKRSIRVLAEKSGNKDILNLVPLLVGNVGLIFTKGDLKEVREEIGKYKVLKISTRINKGCVEIITPVEIVKKGEKVASSEAALLSKLGIKPFSYGLTVVSVYDNGSVFSPEVLDLTDDDLIEEVCHGCFHGSFPVAGHHVSYSCSLTSHVH